jgi:hypothetical protein
MVEPGLEPGHLRVLSKSARQADRVIECLLGVAVVRRRLGVVGGIVHLVVGRFGPRFEPSQFLLIDHGGAEGFAWINP